MDVSMIPTLIKEDIMDNALLFLKDNAVSVGIVLTIVGLIGGAIGASVRFLIDNKKIENEKKALRQQMITNNIAPMRQKWINELREKIARFLAIATYLRRCNTEGNKENISNDVYYLRFLEKVDEFYSVYYSIEIMLPSQKEKNKEELSESIRESLNKIRELITNSTTTNKILNDTINRDLVKIRNLLKQEWEVTKSLKEIE